MSVSLGSVLRPIAAPAASQSEPASTPEIAPELAAVVVPETVPASAPTSTPIVAAVAAPSDSAVAARRPVERTAAGMVRAVEAQRQAVFSPGAPCTADHQAAAAASSQPLMAVQALANAAYAMIAQLRPDPRANQRVKMI